jgi:anti-sigma regulatory factor (Ser/Thr protein kinase)
MCLKLPRRLDAASAAREYAQRSLDEVAVSEDCLHDALFVVSELSASAVVDAHSHFELCVAVHDAIVSIRVRDWGVRPHRPMCGRLAPGGIGLRIVEEFSLRWGVTDNGDGKTVWCEMPLQ